MNPRAQALEGAIRAIHSLQRRKAVTPEALKARFLEEFPPELAVLFDPHRYKVAWSGRYAQKSWGFADALLIQGVEQPLRIVCLRETMKSLEDSVHALMRDQVGRLGLGSHYRVMDSEVRGRNGTNIFYAGLRGANAISIKSMEGIDRAWVEEGQGVSKESWSTLIPTIRKRGAEIWVSFNPRFADDDTHKRFILAPPPDSVVIKLNWRLNRFLTAAMKSEIDFLRLNDPDEYEHVYEGACKSTIEDAVYKAQIQEAEKSGRICNVPHDPRKPVDTFWDLGYADMVSMWFAQPFPFETRVIDYYENSRQPIDHYLQVMQSKDYTLGECVLPWDGGAKHVSTGRSTADIMRSKGFKVRVLPQGFVHDKINYLRMLFPTLYFDGLKCALGLDHLRKYQWGPGGAQGTAKREPLHDEHSHAANALEYLAQGVQMPTAGQKPQITAPRKQFGSLGGFR